MREHAVNKLHPLIHVLICLFFSSLVFILGSPRQLLLITLLSALYAVLRIKGGVAAVLKSIWHSLPLVLSLAIIQLFFNRQGESLWQSGWLRITDMGLFWGGVFALRLFTIILCSKALAALSFPQFQAAFATLRIPEEFSFMLSYGVQLVPRFLAQIRSFISALHLRGIDLKQLKISKRLRLYKILAISALAGVISGSTYAAITLELRGFRSSGKRSYLHESKLCAIDALAVLLMLLCLGFILLW